MPPECVVGVGDFLFIRQAGLVEWGPAVLVLEVGIGTFFDQHLHHLVVAILRISVREE